MVDMVHRLQDSICAAVEAIDGVTYREDRWTREEGGGGRSRVFSDGAVFEKAGVNVSVVQGTLSPEAAAKMGGGHDLDGDDLSFFATGLSLVLHPHNPMAPTVPHSLPWTISHSNRRRRFRCVARNTSAVQARHLALVSPSRMSLSVPRNSNV